MDFFVNQTFSMFSTLQIAYGMFNPQVSKVQGFYICLIRE